MKSLNMTDLWDLKKKSDYHGQEKKSCYCNTIIDSFIIWLLCKTVLGLHVKMFFGVGSSRDLCEKRSWAASMTVPNGSPAAQIWAHQLSGCASIKTYLGKGKNHSTIHTQPWKKLWEKCKINSPADNKVSEGGQEVTQVLERFPYSQWRRHC